MTVINTNVKALVAQDSMRQVNLKLATAMERLSTGLRINSAKDDAAGLAISERMNAQVRGLGMAIKNANDGLSMSQTADGAYGEVTSMLQRMRELAVQAATGSMSKLDRESIQLEIEELKAEIENVATKTHFNNIKLLDGTAQDVTLQVGANQGDTIQIGFDSVRTKDIGSGDKPALTSVGGSATYIDAFSAGSLVLNGVLVNSSLRTDDNLSYFVAEGVGLASASIVAASAIAKVAAINRVSEFSGVTAKVNDTTVMGSTMTATPSALAAAALTINGVSTASIALGTDSETNREMVAKAINDISGQTGVRANNTGDDQQGVTLVADDGRNITLQFDSNSVLSSTNTGLSTSGTFVGTFSLYSANGASINVDNRIGSDLTGTGLRSGTYEPDIAAMVSLERSGSGAPAAANAIVGQAAGISPSAGGVGVLSGDTLVINDIAISAARTTDDTASIATTASAKAASAIAIAAAINKKSDLTGVTARAEPNVIRSETDSSFVSTSASGSINLNGVTISLSAPTRNTVIDVINEFSGQTGVVARVYGEGVELVAEDGRNIVLATSAELSASNLGLAGITLGGGSTVYQTGETPTAGAGVAFYASVSLTSDRAFTVARGSEGGENFERLGFRAGLFGGNDTGTKIDEVNVSTQEGASAAIGAIDHALEDVYAAQAKSGAYQNRLDVIINVLSESTENLQASRSRILDADYALEATNLAKAQIVSQAATAMLAQANQSQQTVLSLLQ
jgi:flagellin